MVISYTQDDFWKRWQNEYLNILQQHDVVLIKEDNYPPLHWPIGQITEIQPASDGIVRDVTARMRSGPFDDLKSKQIKDIKAKEFKRPATELIYLPIMTD